ncbi:MAG: hypothetical protein L0I76_24235, partial [Pseudonocardia sp.]|nr:hypothetical protein [Pseudonocardia sp.]
HRDWNVLAHPDGRLTWVTPTGRQYTSGPYDYRPYTDQPNGTGPPDGTATPDGIARPGDAVTSDDASSPRDDAAIAPADDPDPPPF